MLSDEQNRYIEKFQELEDILTKGTNKSFSDVLEEKKIKIIQEEYSFLKSCKNIRNILSHNNQTSLIIPTEDLINRVEKIINILKKTVFDISIKEIYTKKMSDNLLLTLKDMREKIFTHVPILDDDENIVGVLSESSVFNYIAKETEIVLELGLLKISDISSELSLERENESFIFVPRKMKVVELKNKFSAKFLDKERLGAVFITENGKSTEKLLGIITSWDICGI